MTIKSTDRAPLDRDELAALVARDIPAGSYVNLASASHPGGQVLDAFAARCSAHRERPMLDRGPEARDFEVDTDLNNGGMTTITELAGASYFRHADSFAMMRGGHLRVVFMAPCRCRPAVPWPTGTPLSPMPPRGGRRDGSGHRREGRVRDDVAIRSCR